MLQAEYCQFRYMNLMLKTETLLKMTWRILRGIEFIYKSPGVNRPLRQMKIIQIIISIKLIYRNQINKVANAVKEIITAIEILDKR